MEMNGITRPSATTIGELDILMRHLQETVQEIKLGMATKQDIAEVDRDIKEMKARSDQYATKAEFNELKEKVEASSLSSSINRWLGIITKAAGAITAVAVLYGAIAVLVHFGDKIKAL